MKWRAFRVAGALAFVTATVVALLCATASDGLAAGAGPPFARALRIPPVLRPPAQDPARIMRCKKLSRRASRHGRRRRDAAARKRCLRALRKQPIVIHMRQTKVPILPGEPTTMWTYNGSFPGPTIDADDGRSIHVRFFNDLPPDAGAMTVHRHGGHDPQHDDGQPDADLIPTGGSRTYDYPMREDGHPERAAFQWYHDHRMDATARNVWNGLAGMFISHDAQERSLPLPRGRYDVPLMIADRSFTADNQLADPFVPASANPLTNQTPQAGRPPSDDIAGDVILVNGVPKPFFEVQPRRYRLRILNATTFQPYNLHLSDGRSFTEIGTESGLLPAPLGRRRMLLGPAERADVVVDFSGLAGKALTLDSVARDDGRSGAGSSPLVDSIMQFRVSGSGSGGTAVPKLLRALPAWTGQAPRSPSRTFVFGLTDTPDRGPLWSINGQPFDPNAVLAEPTRGSVETWRFANDSTVAHFIHVHDSSGFEVARNGAPPPPEEAALKDTWRIDPGDTVDVAFHFADYTGKFVIHCHMLNHEDNGMMAFFRVVSPGAGGAKQDLAGTGSAFDTGGSMLPSELAFVSGTMHAGHAHDPRAHASHSHGPTQLPTAVAIPTWLLSIGGPLVALLLLRRRRGSVGDLRRRAAAVALLCGVAATHAAHLGETLAEAPYVAALFAALIASAALLSVALAWVRDSAPVLRAAGATCALAIGVYLFSRAVGLPQLDNHVGAWIDPLGIAAILCESGVVLAAAGSGAGAWLSVSRVRHVPRSRRAAVRPA